MTNAMLKIPGVNICDTDIQINYNRSCNVIKRGLYITFIDRDIHEKLRYIHEYIELNMTKSLHVVFHPSSIIIINAYSNSIRWTVFDLCNSASEFYKGIVYPYETVITIFEHKTQVLKQLYEYRSDELDYYDKIDRILKYGIPTWLC